MGRTIRTGGRLIIVAAAVLAFAAPVQAKGAVDTTITLISAGPVEPFTTTGGALCPVSGRHCIVVRLPFRWLG